ncbi:MAG: DASS family sodium-coupled anion symporter, partial [Tolumonas sp.]|nr:DASS family sodium-coupled anion symporter [Tolumonas sp.]
QMGLSFIQWMRIGIPIVLILLPIAIVILFFFFKPKLNRCYTPESITFTWTIKSQMTLAIFVCTVIAWICSLPLSNLLGGIAQLDTLIALIAAVLICLTGVASWRDIERQTEWGVLVLFGGGITLSAVLKDTGASLFLAQHITAAFATTYPLFLFCIIASFVVFLTEFTSNTATAALLVPLFAGVAESLGISAIITSVMVSVACSCAFMLPVATPPNAIVFSSGLIRQKDMIRVGLLLNIACIILLTGLYYVDI